VGLFICAFLRKLLFLIIPSNDSGIHAKEKEMLYSPEELKLVPDISYYFNLLNLQLNKYEIITADGFVISVHRIIDPYESIRLRQARKPVLLLHGLLQSSGSFCSSGKDSLAYMLFKAGYDVWLGNNRCGLEPRHINYSPSDYQMWNWDIIDMAKYDLTAIIDHVLANSDSKSSTLALICHSQGTTQGFITIDNDRFGNNAKISCFVALSPAVYSGSIIHDKTFIKIIAKMTLNPFFFGVWAFMPLMMTMRNLLVGSKVFGYLSYTMFNYLFDWNDSLWDRSLRDRHFLFSPVFVSVKLMSWWLNDKTGFKISKAILQDDAAWFKSDSPKIFLVVPKKDKLVDGEALISHLHNYEDPSTFSYIFLDDYSHLDVLWSETVIRDIGNPILDFLQKNEF
jgi:pimeloyl-ACP methyl ester carboxylesterase